MIVVLTTGTRPLYLQRTLDSIEQSAPVGVRRALVIDSAEWRDVARPGWEVVHAPRPCVAPDNKWAMWAALRLMAAQGDELNVFSEDDFEWCAGAAAWALMWSLFPRDVAWVSMFAAGGDDTMHPALWRTHCKVFNFCQGLVFPKRTLIDLTSTAGQLAMANSRMGGSDEVLREIGGAAGWHYGVVYPSGGQHIGAESVVDPSRDLRAGRYSRAFRPGTNFLSFPHHLYE